MFIIHAIKCAVPMNMAGARQVIIIKSFGIFNPTGTNFDVKLYKPFDMAAPREEWLRKYIIMELKLQFCFIQTFALMFIE